VAIRKYIRDEKGRFAKVANNHPEGTFFHNMSAADQKAVNNQEKRDRAKARAEKAKLLATAEKNTQPVQPEPAKPTPAPKFQPKPFIMKSNIGASAPASSPAPEVKVGATPSGGVDLTPEGKAKARAEAKRARAKARREKAKNALDDNPQPVTVTAAPKAAKPAKVGPSPEQQQYRQESAKLKESHAKVKKLEEDL
jgi:hypothetical protein